MTRIPTPSIGIITALPHEYAAVKVLLHGQREVFVPGRGTGRRYTLGHVPAANGTHTIALTLLVDMGNNSAAIRATQMIDVFPSVQDILMVGIAGGVPAPHDPEHHVRLGDIVISDLGGVVQYDFDKESVDIVEHRHRPRPPSALLLEGVALIEAEQLMGRRPWLAFIRLASTMLQVNRPPDGTDTLADSQYPQITIPHPSDEQRLSGEPQIFRGTIASANKLLKNPLKRDTLRDKFNIRAVEMEASGIADATWNQATGYLVIRGICDYCDKRKGDAWQKYAAIVPY
jgi:nucleoside phosphorylase